MVQRGQFLERATLIPSGKNTLEGLWHRGTKGPAALLIPPRPGEGSMDAAALNELAFALSRAGHPSLRFNFGGVGASQGGSKTPAQLEADARAALAVLQENAELDEVAAVAFRSGAEVALRLLDAVAAVVLVSPPETLDLAPLAGAQVGALIAVPESDPLRAKWSGHAAQTGDRLAVVEGADAAWNRGLVQLGRTVVEFFEPR